mgnify:CR=1 FL=1
MTECAVWPCPGYFADISANNTEDRDERELLDRLCGWLHRVEFAE